MQAVIKLDVPEWQIGQPVTVYFPDTMQKHGVCELPKENEPKEPVLDEYGNKRCAVCGKKLQSISDPDMFCCKCGQAVKYE